MTAPDRWIEERHAAYYCGACGASLLRDGRIIKCDCDRLQDTETR